MNISADIKPEAIRTAWLLGEDAPGILARAHVAVFGVGGVGGFACEALARAGVGTLELIDNDTVSLSNINRQLIALHSTVGRLKVDVMAERIRDINPDCRVITHPCFYQPGDTETFPLTGLDYLVDAIDTVGAKIDLAVRAKAMQIPIIAAMGAGNKLDPARFEVADLAKTSVCPLARVMRIELRKRGIQHMKVVYSREEARRPEVAEQKNAGTRSIAPGSVPFVPGVVGMILAGEVIRDLLDSGRKNTV